MLQPLIDDPAAVALLGDAQLAGVEPREAFLDGVAQLGVGSRGPKLRATFPSAFDDGL